MAESTPDGLVSSPITPGFSQIKTDKDPFALLDEAGPIVKPLIPDGMPTSTLRTEQLQGDYKGGPNSGIDLTEGTGNYIKALQQQILDPETTKDKYKYARQYSFGSDHKAMNFERYYNHNKFKELGFSPYRNNDAVYNERGSWWDDFNRMSGEWLGLVGAGFKSVWGSEVEANKAMEKGMAIGMSTKDGFGAKVTNFGLNSAYTVGILSEMALENVALAGLELASFGTATPAILARNAMTTTKLAKALGMISEIISQLRKADKAREFHTMVRAGTKIEEIANWINPLGRTMQYATDLKHATGGLKNLSAKAKMVRGFGEFYRDLREINLAHSEARLEGEGAAVEYQDRLIDEYYAEHGVVPEGKDAEEIYNRAQSVKAAVTMSNDGAIYLTNKLVFANMFGGRGGAKIADSFLKGSGRVLKKTSPKLYKLGQDVVGAKAATGLGKTINTLTSSKYLPWSKQYMLGNVTEGLQESSQEAIQIAVKDYHDKIYTDPTQVGFYSKMASFGKGVDEQFSERGVETFLSGYLMGALIQGAGAASTNTVDRIKSAVKGTRTEAQRSAEHATQTDNDIMSAANYIGKNSLRYSTDKVDTLSKVKVASDKMNEAAEDGDIKESKDFSHQSSSAHFNTLARTGNMGLITTHVDEMLDLTDEELETAYPEKADVIRKKLNDLKTKALDYQAMYDQAVEDMPNLHNPWLFDAKRQPELFQQEYNSYKAHEEALADVVYSQSRYADLGKRLTSMANDLAGNGDTSLRNLVKVSKAGSPVANAVGQDVMLLLDSENQGTTIAMLDEQIAVLNGGTAEQQREAKKLIKRRKLIKDWQNYITTLQAQMLNETDSALIKETVSNMRDTFGRYLHNIAKEKNGYIFNENMDKAFDKIIDFYRVKSDEGKMVGIINVLADPTYRARYINALANKDFAIKEQERDRLQKALDKFTEAKKLNNFLGRLFDIGVFAMPDDIERLKAFTEVDFYDIVDKKIIPKDSDRYKEILDIIEEYSVKATDKPIPESKTDDKYNNKGRAKDAEDKRTYADHAKQFGFTTSALSTRIPAEQVLKAVIDSKFATSEEKALARRFLTTVEPGYHITFNKNLSTPGSYSRSSDVTAIDPRYSSFDYTKGAVGHPIELIILHEYSHKLTVNGLQKDTAFNDKISELNSAAEAYQLSPEGKTKFGDKPLYGTKNNAEFVAEALSNPHFREMLQQIPYDVTGKPGGLWSEFVNAIKEYFNKLLVLAKNTTLLDEALNIITAKIDGAKPATTTKDTSIDPVTPLAQIKAADIETYNKLINAYREELTERIANDEAVDVLPDAPAEAIANSKGFKDFVETNSKAFKILNSKKPIAPAEPTPVKEEPAKSRWSTTAIYAFNGVVIDSEGEEIRLSDKKVKVINDNQYTDEDGDFVHMVTVKDVATGEEYIFNAVDNVNKNALKEVEANDWIGLVNNAVTERELDVITDQSTAANEYTPQLLELIAIKRKSLVKAPPVVKDVIAETEEEEESREYLIGRLGHLEGLKETYRIGKETTETTPSSVIIANWKKISIESAEAETGLTVGNNKDIHNSLAGKGGKTVEAAAEYFAENYENEMAGMEVSDIRDLIIDILTAGSIKKYTEGDTTTGIQAINREIAEITAKLEKMGDLMEKYDRINSKESLDLWEKEAGDVLSSRKRMNYYKAQGVNISAKNIEKMIADKEAYLATNITFGQLIPGTVVLMKDGKTAKVVKSKNAKNVVLISYADYANGNPDPSKTTIAKGEIKNQIKMKHSDFIDKADADPILTKEQEATSDEVLKATKEDSPIAGFDAAAEARKENKSTEETDNDFIDDVNNCSN